MESGPVLLEGGFLRVALGLRGGVGGGGFGLEDCDTLGFGAHCWPLPPQLVQVRQMVVCPPSGWGVVSG